MLRRPPRRDGDNESVEDVDDDEFEAVLGGSAGGAVTPGSITAVLPVRVAECVRVCVCLLRLLRGRLLVPGLGGPGPGLCRVKPPTQTQG